MVGCWAHARRKFDEALGTLPQEKRKDSPAAIGECDCSQLFKLEQWLYLTRYLEDGRLELSNNRAERSIKPFVMGGKNWLFANTPGGAQASSVIYSLIETAKANGLDPYRYLLWLLQNAPQLSETDEAWKHGLKACFPQMPRKNAICLINKRPPSR